MKNMKSKTQTEKCKCPFCDNELKLNCFEPIFCEPCNIEFVICKKCGKLYNKKLKKCPECKE